MCEYVRINRINFQTKQVKMKGDKRIKDDIEQRDKSYLLSRLGTM